MMGRMISSSLFFVCLASGFAVDAQAQWTFMNQRQTTNGEDDTQYYNYSDGLRAEYSMKFHNNTGNFKTYWLYIEWVDNTTGETLDAAGNFDRYTLGPGQTYTFSVSDFWVIGMDTMGHNISANIYWGSGKNLDPANADGSATMTWNLGY